MIHDATVEVTCDGEKCRESVYVELRAGTRDSYIANDEDIERGLKREHEWTVEDGKHYCQSCRP